MKDSTRLCNAKPRSILFGLLIFAALPSWAVHDLGLFELDGNAVEEGAPGDDWRQIWCDSVDPGRAGICAAVPASNALTSTFANDKFNDGTDDIFAGAKDSRDINAGAAQDWLWKLGSANDKNDIEHSFAAIYQVDDPGDPSDDDFILYFGLDKFSNNGDAAIGFWFVQNDIDMVGDGTKDDPNCSNNGCPFSDGHEFGDVLVQADITSGGDLVRYDVYTWGPNTGLNDPVAPAQGDLTLAFEGTDCGSASSDDLSCGISNTQTETSPWPFSFKGGTGDDDFAPSTFFEAGINLTKLFPDGIPCLSTFIAETRQSQSETAELEDKVFDGFELCAIDAEKTGPALSKVGDTATYTITVENTGITELTKVSIIDSLIGDITNNGDNGAVSDCGPTLAAGATCTITVERVIQPGDLDPLTNVVDVVYSQDSTQVSDSDSHDINLFQPSVTLDKKADGSDGPISVDQGDNVEYTINVANTSSADTPTLDCTLNDANLGIVNQPLQLGPGDDTTVTQDQSFAFPSNNPPAWCVPTATGWQCKNTADVVCSPAGFPNQLPASDMVTVNVIKAQVALAVVKTGPAYSKVGDTIDYSITISNNHPTNAVTLTSINDTILGDLTDGTNAAITASDCPVAPATLAAGDSCTITLAYLVPMGAPNPVINEVTVQGEDEFANASSANDDHSVALVSPSLTVSKTCLQTPIEPGQSANFNIDIENTGDVALNIHVVDVVLSINQTHLLGTGAGCVFDADPSDGCLRVSGGVIAGTDDVANQVSVTWTLPAQFQLDNTDTVYDDAICEVIEREGATRTLGFWRTHGDYTCHVLENHAAGGGAGTLLPVDLGWRTAIDCEDVFGIFWSSPARESDGDRRGRLCKAKLQASWQLLAAILNTGLSNGATTLPDGTPVQDVIDDLVAELGGDMDFRTIKRLASLLDLYNNSGDDVAIIDADGAMIAPADPNGTKAAADFSAGDCP